MSQNGSKSYGAEVEAAKERAAVAEPVSPAAALPAEEWRGDAWELSTRLQNLAAIGTALSSERDLSSLMERILTEARRLTHADAGTIYMLREDGLLHGEVTHNDTQRRYCGGTSGMAVSLRPLAPEARYVSGHVALAGETVNIPDVYEAEGFDFSGTREYDRQSGYRSRSMLVVPMRNHEDAVVGVLQLINARAPGTDSVIPFAEEGVGLVQCLASQAAVALTNAQLIQSLQAFIEALMNVMAKAVDEKDPTTAGHVERVTRLSLALAGAVHAQSEGPLAGREFSDDEMDELRIAGWMHDVGKLTTPEWVLKKGRKLEAIVDRAELLRERFRAIDALCRAAGLEQKLAALAAGAPACDLEAIDCQTQADRAQIQDDLAFLLACNEPGEAMEEERLARLREIGARSYVDADGMARPFVLADEMENLSIRRGSITFKELQVMRDHVSVTIKMLSLVPFPARLRNVPRYAGQHHEMLNGSGYPLGLTADELPLQSRILAVCDVFDALSAPDRPYKKAFTLEKCLSELRSDAGKGRLDPDLVELFIQSRLWERVGLHGG